MNVSEIALRLLNEWNWDPSILIGTTLFVGVYLGASGPFRSRFQSSGKIALSQILWFLLGVGIIFFALVSPLDAIGDRYLFSAHMLQHMLLMVVAPPMLLLGTPGWMVRPLLFDRVIRRAVKTLTLPPVAFFIFNADLLIWHIPFLYEATLQNEVVHIIEHLSFIATGIVNWWPMLSPLPEFPRLSYIWQIVYLILDSVPMMALGWFFVSASTVIYPTYAAAPHVFAIYGLNDQFLGGLMMGMPVGMIYMGALTNAGERLRLTESQSSS
jgi:cytochrome c oxidase assembly factor CtaG